MTALAVRELDLQLGLLAPIQRRGKSGKRACPEIAGQIRDHYLARVPRDPPMGNGHGIGQTTIATEKIHIFDLEFGPDVLQALAQDQSP